LRFTSRNPLLVRIGARPGLRAAGLFLAGALFLWGQVPAPAVGQELTRRLDACAHLQDPAERLACYDALARSLGLTPPPPRAAADTTGGWGVSTKQDPLDDSQVTTLYLGAESLSPPSDREVFLFIRCRHRQLEVYITWDRPLANGEVLVRLGEGPSERQYWNLSTDQEASLVPGDSAAFVRGLLAVQRLVAKVNPRDSVPVAAVFRLDGLATMLGRVPAECLE